MTTPTQWPGYQPPTFVGYPDPIADPSESRNGQPLDEAFFTALTRAVAGAAPRMTSVGMVTPAEGQIARVDASSGNVSMPALPALPAGAIVGYERIDAVVANTITITSGSHVLRFRGHLIKLISRGAGIWDRLDNWLPVDGLDARYDARFDARYTTPQQVQQAVAAGGGGGGGGSIRPRFFDDFAAVADGPLDGRVSDSGDTWLSVAGSSGYAPVVRGGAISAPAAYTPGGSDGTQKAGYAYWRASAQIVAVGGLLRWDASDSVLSGACLGAFTTTNVHDPTNGSNLHLALQPWGVQMSVASGGTADLSNNELVPDGFDTSYPRFGEPMRCDGVSVYRVECVIDRARSRCYVTIGDYPTLVYSHPYFASVQAMNAFWEFWGITGGDNMARWLAVWAEQHNASPLHPHAARVATAAIGAGPALGGAGPAARRPSARMRPGSTWWDSGVATTLSAATAAGDTTFTAPVPIPVGSSVVIDTGVKGETRTVTARSGSGPYTYTVAALLAAHSSGVAITAGAKQTISDGYNWRDSATSLIVGNRLTLNQAIASESAALSNSSGAPTIRQSRAPVPKWRVGTAHKLTATAAGDFVVFAQTVLAEPGTPFFAGIGQALAGVNARQAKVGVRFFNAAASPLALLESATVTVPTGTEPTEALLTAAAVAPAGTTSALILITVIGCAVGDVFYLVDLCVAPGSVPAHVRT